MSNSFTLDDIRAAADKKYGSVFIDPLDGEGEVELVNALRLPKDQRKELMSTQKELSKKEKESEEKGEEATFEDSIEDLKRSIILVARTKHQGQRLVDACGEDPALLMSIFEKYTGDTELGEASPSQD